MTIRAIVALLAALTLGASDLPAGEATPLYKDASRATPERVEDLLRRMTLEEKVAQMITVWNSKPAVMDAQLQIDAAKLKTQYPNGLGQFARPSDSRGPASPRMEKGRDPRQTVELVNAVQRYAVTQTRLGIPVLFHEEGLHGYAAVGATSFPQAT